MMLEGGVHGKVMVLRCFLLTTVMVLGPCRLRVMRQTSKLYLHFSKPIFMLNLCGHNVVFIILLQFVHNLSVVVLTHRQLTQNKI